AERAGPAAAAARHRRRDGICRAALRRDELLRNRSLHRPVHIEALVMRASSHVAGGPAGGASSRRQIPMRRSFRSSLAALVMMATSCGASAALPEAKRLLSLDDMLQRSEVEGAVIAPDGAEMAVQVTRPLSAS